MRGVQWLVLWLVLLLSACSSDAPPETRRGEADAPEPAAASQQVQGAVGEKRAASALSPRGDDSAPSAVGVAEDDQAVPASADRDRAPEADARYRELVLGTWEDDYEGHRTMTLNEDGTGTMVVELSGVKAALFAARLEFNMEWTLVEGRLQKRTLDGKPARRVEMILKMMGDRVDEPILELTKDRLLLLDKDGTTRYDWRRKKGGSEPVPVERTE